MNILKKIIFAALLLLGGKSICFAQEISIRGGFNLSQFRYTYGDKVVHEEGAKLNPGFNAGAILDLPLKDMFSIEAGLLLNSKGDKISGNEIMGVNKYLQRENLLYLDIPILVKISVPVKKVKIFAMVGPYLGQALSGKRKGEGIINSVPSNWEHNIYWGEEYDRVDYGGKIGIGLRYNKYQIGASYEFGFKNLTIVRPSTANKNRVLELYVSYVLINLKSNKK